MAGLVPQVTIGSSSRPAMTTVRSNVAPSSVGRSRQRFSASAHAAPFGAAGRPLM
jgi:hypothetical protein